MGSTHVYASDPRIQRLEEEWRHHRDAAIRNNEGPQGRHRRHAEGLQRRLQELRHAHSPGTRSPGLSLAWAGLAFMASLTFGSSLWQAVLREQKTMNSGGSAAPVVVAAKPKPSAQSVVRPAAHPQPPQRTPDPALTMQGRFHGSKFGGRYAALDAGFNNYQRLSGTLARIQTLALKRRERAHQLPTVWINRTREDCFPGPSIGMYNSQCHVIKLDYSDGYSTYEHPVEMEVTLAHEWGHHLISLSGVAMSPTEQEVVSDCFAGAVFGYYVRNNLIGLQDAVRAIELVEYVGNNSPSGHHPNRETRLRSFAGGLFSVGNPADPRAPEFMASCASLDQLVDVKKIREMGTTWNS
jgi:hypothetical protein